MKLAISIFIILLLNGIYSRYTPDWNSLDTRPLPQWYDDAKIGIFIHWGVFSVPSWSLPGKCEDEGIWRCWKRSNPVPEVVQFMEQNYPPDFTYPDFAKDFRAELFDPIEWAELLQASGAKYVVLTSKHGEGYCLWPSATSWNWNAMDVGPNRDLVQEIANAIRNTTDLKFGVYYALQEWFNDLYLQDTANNYTTNYFINAKIIPEWYDVVNRYQPDVFWSDIDGSGTGNDSYWNATSFIAWLYNDSPVKDTVVVNDRWAVGDRCKHGDFYTCTDNYNPGSLQNHKWERCMKIDKYSWGYRRNMNLDDVLNITELVTSITETISCGGNILINIGPTKDGIIDPVFQERLRQLGQWLNVNGEAVYSSRPWKYQNDTVNENVWYTRNPSTGYVYAILLSYPADSKVVLGAPVVTSTTKVSMLGYQGNINWIPAAPSQNGLQIDLSSIDQNNLPSSTAWVFRLQDVN